VLVRNRTCVYDRICPKGRIFERAWLVWQREMSVIDNDEEGLL
jgi:hypothetical protein